jgi:putative addiction module component (TIGR02574 family)
VPAEPFALQPRAIMRQWPAGCKRLLGGESERKIGFMTKAAEAVLAEALRLDLDARAQVAAELLASLDGPADPDAEAAWALEIERRVAAIEAGAVTLEPWTDVKRRIEKEILGR